MTAKRRILMVISLWAALVMLVAGCASVGDQRVNVLYQRAANASGGSGDLYLVQDQAQPSGGNSTIQWVLGDIKDKDGNKLGNTVTDTAPADTLLAAYAQEFKGAGYNTIQGSTFPSGVSKGVVLKSGTVRLDEVKSASNLEAKCKVTLVVEPWREGKALGNLEFEADYTETAVTGRDELPSKVELEAIKIIMRRSVPQIIKELEQ